MEKEKDSSKDLIKTEPNSLNPNVHQMSDFSHLPSLANAVESLVGSKNSRFKTKSDIVLAAQFALDAKVSLSTILNKGYVLNGVVSVEYPVLLAILAMNGVIVTEIEDCRPLYTYNQREFKIDQDTFDANKDKYEVFNSTAEYKMAHDKELLQKNKIQLVRSSTPYDYRTTLQGKRMMWYNGKQEEVIKRVSFSFTDAQTAELVNNGTNMYIKYLSDMLMGKAVPRLCWRIGSDLVHGAIDNATQFEINDKKYDYSKEASNKVEILESDD